MFLLRLLSIWIFIIRRNLIHIFLFTSVHFRKLKNIFLPCTILHYQIYISYKVIINYKLFICLVLRRESFEFFSHGFLDLTPSYPTRTVFLISWSVSIICPSYSIFSFEVVFPVQIPYLRAFRTSWTFHLPPQFFIVTFLRCPDRVHIYFLSSFYCRFIRKLLTSVYGRICAGNQVSYPGL